MYYFALLFHFSYLFSPTRMMQIISDVKARYFLFITQYYVNEWIKNRDMNKQKALILFLGFFYFALAYGQNNTESLPTYSPKGSLSLRTNVIPWLALMPNVGVEYKVTDEFGILVDGGWAHWNLNTTNKYWRMWDVAPQARYYFGSFKYNYIGAQYTMGEYNLSGRQGKYMGGGLTLGHQFYAGKNLMVDLGISLGYLHLYDKEKYQRINGEDYRDGKKTANGYWGPTGLSMTFVWKIN